MRIIGIDPGIERTGFAVLEIGKNGSIVPLDIGCITTDKNIHFAARLSSLVADLESVLLQWRPVAAGIEQIFFSKNVKSAIKVSHARGVIMEALENKGVAMFELNPGQIKMSVAGNGRATKHEVKKMIQYLMGISIKNDDTADAIACGICLLSTHRNEII